MRYVVRLSRASGASRGIRTYVRRLVFLAPSLLAFSLGAAPAPAQGIASGDSSGAYVRVSREEVRVYFPPETSSAWGSATWRAEDGQTLLWAALLDGDFG